MKLFNYYETLTSEQKEKFKDKRGALLYYEWFDRLYDNVSLEVAGAMLLATIFYDMNGGTKKIPPKLMKVIKSDKAASVLFETLLDRTHAGSREWINRHGKRNRDHNKVDNNDKKTNLKPYSDTEDDDFELPF